MSISVVFRFEGDDFVPFDLPGGSAETWKDVIERQGFRTEVSMALGRPHGGLHVEVHTAEHMTAPYQEFGFLAAVRIGEAVHPVLCRDLPELLHFLHVVIPIVELDLRCTEENAALNRLPGVRERFRLPFVGARTSAPDEADTRDSSPKERRDRDRKRPALKTAAKPGLARYPGRRA
jgi:hypothetical protein